MSYAETLKEDFKHLNDKVVAFEAEQNIILFEIKRISNKIESIKASLAFYNKEKDLLKATGKKIRENVYSEIEKIVTHFLQYIFEKPDLQFRIEPVYYERRTELRFWTTKEFIDEKTGETTQYLINPLESRGGGIINVLTFALYLAVDLWLDPPNAGPWRLDEIFKNVSEQYIPKCIELLKIIEQRYGRQSIIVTHNSQLLKWSDEAYSVSLNASGFSEIKRIDS